MAPSSQILFKSPAGMFDPTPHNYSHVSIAESPTRLVHLAGQVGIDQRGQIPETFEGQARLIFENIKACLAEAGATVKDIVMLTVYVVDYSSNTAIFPLLKEFLTLTGNEIHKPPQAVIPVTQLAIPNTKVEVLVVAVAPEQPSGGPRL